MQRYGGINSRGKWKLQQTRGKKHEVHVVSMQIMTRGS
jgi:hypothetical protein